MKAKSIKGKSAEEIHSALAESISDGFMPTLAIVFLAIKQDRKLITDILNDNAIQVFGATTAGEFIDGDIEEGSTIIMLLDMKREYFKISFYETGEQTTLENAKLLGAKGKSTFSNPAFIIVSGWLSNDGENSL